MIDGVKRRAWACMNEVHFGAPLPLPFAVLFKAKCSPRMLRKLTLEGARFTPQELLEAEMVDELGDSTKSVLAKAQELGEKHSPNASSGVWGQIKVSCQHSTFLMVSQGNCFFWQKAIYYEVFNSFTVDQRIRLPDEVDQVALAKL
jgi:enoyl-CoA hydratase/carnithine racemase